MSIFKCKMCGGDLDITAGVTVCECEYCGTRQTVPAADNEKKMTLFSRANRLLRGCEFDKAAGVFESIVVDFPEEAEAYWGLVLCKYGIEYVDDPTTARKVPTCHRSSFDSVMDDANFEQACENADSTARKVYRDEAKAIEELRKGIIEVSGKEKPYGIFICYKETAENGERTLDSVLAQDVYDALTEKGYRVFFSRVTLEDKLGQEYEPYIFAALNSAKVMLAFGTDYDYYNAVWVKNEWSRFLQLIAKGEKKVLIPCYKGIDAYDLPKEFAKLQAQDLGKVGAMQDLLRGIEKILPREQTTGKAAPYVSEDITKVTAALKRGNMALEDGEWTRADEMFEHVLMLDAENAQAYLGKLMAELHISKKDELKNCDTPFDGNNNYQKAVRFGDTELPIFIKFINDRNENTRLTNIYDNAVNAMQSADTEEKYKSVADTFKTIAGFRNADILMQQCLEQAEQLKQERLKNEEAERLEAEREAEAKRISAEKAAKKRKKVLSIVIPVACACIALAIVLTTVIIPSINRKSAYAKYGETLNNADVGDTVVFGAYEQDNDLSNGKENIEWLVLAKEDNKLFVISKYALDCQQYNSSYTFVDWEGCTLRSWLNDTFFNTAFNGTEKSIIAMTKVLVGQNTTDDKLFLLNISETRQYFGSNDARQCKATSFAVANGASINTENGNCWWLLRYHNSDKKNRVAYINSDGLSSSDGIFVDTADFCVRPAMWISLES